MTQEYADKIAADFTEFLNEFHSYSQPYDDAMDAELHAQYARVLNEQSRWGYFPFEKGLATFGPSSAGKSDRELYEKVRKSKRDTQTPLPHQRRWTSLGSQIGDMVQREIMLAERHYEKFTGKAPRFRFAKTDRGEPCFEHFTKKLHKITHEGETFGMFGLSDGILEYTTDDGVTLRVGLEVKSRQKSYSEINRMDKPKHAHVLQTVSYSEMYDLDYFIILYVSAAKKDWFEYYPDIKAFGRHITDHDRKQLKDKLAKVVRMAREGTPPGIDLLDWRFNEFKGAIATAMTDDEFATVKRTVKQAQAGNLADWQKRAAEAAYFEIKELRDGA